MPRAGPRREQEQQAGAVVARNGAPLVGIELEERPGLAVERLVAGVDTDRPVEDDEERRLLHRVVAERLPGAQLDEDGPLGALLRVEDDGDRAPRGVSTSGRIQLRTTGTPFPHPPGV